MNYSEKLGILRVENGLTQKEVGEILQISRSTYSDYELNSKTMPIKHLNTLCNYFNVSLDYIFGFTNEKNYKVSQNEINNIIMGKRLKEFRDDSKLTQAQLAEQLSTLHQTIGNYEKGKSFIATPFLYMICKKYKVSADYLLGKIDEPKYLK